MTGSPLHYLLVAFLWLGAIVHYAVVCDHTVRESHLLEAFRRIFAIGLAGLALRFTFVLIDEGSLSRTPWYSILSLTLIAFGAFGTGLEKLIDAPPRHRPPPVSQPNPAQARHR